MLTCSQYDYIEIVCTFKYPITLILHDGENIVGVALDTCLNHERDECIKIEDQGNSQLIDLASVAELRVNIDNPHFQTISFAAGEGN